MRSGPIHARATAVGVGELAAVGDGEAGGVGERAVAVGDGDAAGGLPGDGEGVTGAVGSGARVPGGPALQLASNSATNGASRLSL